MPDERDPIVTIDPVLATALLDGIDRLRDGINLALDCLARDIQRIRKKEPPDATQD